MKVTSTAPIVAERCTYFYDEPHDVSGAYDVIGSPSTGSDWFFAEGYTGNAFAETITIANMDDAPVKVTLTLKSQKGRVKSFSLPMKAHDQVLWKVNNHNTFGGSPEVSAEIQAPKGRLVVQREMSSTTSTIRSTEAISTRWADPM